MTKLMKGKLPGIAVACLLVASLVIAGAMAPAITLAHPDPSVSVDPATQTVAAGGTFSVDVLVDSDAIPITACNVTITFDGDDLTATGTTGADLLGASGVAALYIPFIAGDEVSYGGARLGAAGAIAVNGNLVTIDFAVDAAATGSYDLVVDATLLDAAGAPIATVVENDGEVVVTGGAPSDASVSIEPATQGVVAGGVFSVDVMVDSAGIPITACNVAIAFDGDDLTATGTTGADLLGAPGVAALYVPLIDVGEVSYGGARLPAAGAIAVDGNLVTIDFALDAAAVGSYDLVVTATLLNAAGNPIAADENDGEVVVSGAGAASVSIDPATQIIEAGGTCSVDVVVDSAGIPISACDVTVTFGADLTATSLTGGDLLGVEGVGALYIPTIDTGMVSYAGARIGGAMAVNGDFVTINFDVDPAATGTYPLVVTATLLNAVGNPIGVVENDGEIEIGVLEFEETFSGTLTEEARNYICTIPGGATELEIYLSTLGSPGPDQDLELYKGPIFVIGEGGLINSEGPGTFGYAGDTFNYSGWSGVGGDPGVEYITSLGPLTQSYDLMVYGYEAGTYSVYVFYVMPGPDNDPPMIDIDAPGGTVGVPATITVSATDPSGVAAIWFGVWDDGYVLTGTNADWGQAMAMGGGTGNEVSVTFTPLLADGYYVAAYAGDTLGNWTPDLSPETASWSVT